MQMPASLKVGFAVETIVASQVTVFVVVQQRADLIGGPDVKAPLLALAVRIQRCVVATFGRLHLPDDPLSGSTGSRLKQWFCRRPPEVAVEAKQGAVIVEHLFEVWDHPRVIGRIAVETAAELVVDSAQSHSGQGMIHNKQRTRVGLVPAPAERPVPQHADQVRRMREFGRPAKTAVNFIEAGEQLPVGAFQWAAVQHLTRISVCRVEARERLSQGKVLLPNLRILLLVGICDTAQ